MATSLAKRNGATHTPEQPHFKRPATTPFQVSFKTLKTSLTVRLPDITVAAEPTTTASDSAFEDALARHVAWKTSMLPWNDSSAAKVVLAVRCAFPDLEDAASLAGMAATFVFGCEVDDAVEVTDRKAATDYILAGVAVLDRGCDAAEEDSTDGDPQKMNGDVRYLCRAYRRHMYSMLGQEVAAAVVADMKRFLLGQLGELENSNFEDLTSYLDLRKESICMAPLLTIVEHRCLGTRVDEGNHACSASHPGVDRAISPLSPLKESMARLCVLQNDIAGLEKDIWTSNSCNALYVLAGMSGTPVSGSTGLEELERLLPRLVAVHDKLVVDVVAAWREILGSPASSAEQRLFGTMVLKLTVLHFRWACSAKRYKIEHKE